MPMIIIPAEILELILSYLYYPVFYPKFLLSCALVSRSWSNHALSFLWSKPFVYDNYSEKIVQVKQIQQFRIFLLFLPNRILSRVGLENYSNKRENFNYDYLSFIKQLHHLKLYEACLKFWKDEIAMRGEINDRITDCTSNHPSKYFLQTKILPIINELYNLIILKYDARIKYFEFSIPRKICSCDYIPTNYFTFSHTPSIFSSALQSFKCNGRYNYPYKKLFEILIKYSKNIMEIKLENFEILEGNLEPMKNLIVSQKRLRSIELGFLIKQDFSDLFDIIKEVSNLCHVKMSYCSFNKILPIKSLSSCKHLKELSIESSEIGCKENSSDEIKPFTSLKSLKIIKSKLPKDIFDYFFSQNSNLEQIMIREMDLLTKYSNIIPLICLNCHQLKFFKIGLMEKTFEKLLEILENCNNLRELTVYYEHYEIEDDYYDFNSIMDYMSVGQVLRRMGKLISYNLKMLHIASFYYFSKDEFKEFLTNCKINGDLRYLSINICGDKVNVMRLLEDYSKEINKDLIIKQWDTKNYDGMEVRFYQIFTVEFR